MSDLDHVSLAARVQGLLHARFKGDVAAAAQQLEVDEQELRAVVEGTDQPHLGVLSALIREYGIDPCWLLTGEYDYDLHRRALLDIEEGDGSTEDVLDLVVARSKRRRAGS